MTDSLRARANTLLGSALDLPTSERAGWVEQASAGDPELRQLVSRLLEKAGQLDGYMEDTAPFVAQLARVPAPAPQPGERIGNWLVVREIGRGGMGVVLLVERGDGVVRQSAALKIIQDGAASDLELARFQSERQILASLNHPDIARLIDAGSTTDGRPYFVMEYSAGVPINQYCTELSLTLAQRVALFARVCSAVHYAHQHLIIHRDLKPANILVARDGTIKLLDFGIAKLVGGHEPDGDGGADTRRLTPVFASPEQLAGTPLSIRTDIYSLGVVLRVLLTGTRSRGDLDNVLLKATRSEPELRYASADDFSRDLSRYLAHKPVQATPSSWWYRTRKLVQRHPWGVTATASAVVSLVLGTAVALWEARQATLAREVAEKRFNDTRALARTMLFEVNDTLEKGPTAAREKLVATALVYLKELANDQALKPELKRDVASAYERIGDVVGNQVGANLGRTSEAHAHYQTALALRQSLANVREPALDDVIGLREVHQRLADIVWAKGDWAQAQRHYDAATAAAKSVVDRTRTSADQIEWFSRRRYSAAILYSRGQPSAGQLPQALKKFGELRADLAAFLASNPGNMDVLRVYVPVLSQWVDLNRVKGDLAEARAAGMLSLALAEKKLKQTPDDPRWQRQLGVTHRQIGDILIEQGDNAAGLVHIRAALALREAVANADPANERAARDVAIGRSALADALLVSGDHAAAQSHYAAARDTFAVQAARNPDNVALRGGQLQYGLALARAQFETGQLPAAAATLASIKQLAGATPQKTGDDVVAASVALLDAQVSATQAPARAKAAYASAQNALATLLKHSEGDPVDVYKLRNGAAAWLQAGQIGLLAGQNSSACVYLRQAADRYDTFERKGVLNAHDRRLRAQGRSALARCTAQA